MKAPATVGGLASRFDRMSLRERALIFAAALAVLVVLWNLVLMDRLNAREKGLSEELTTLETSMASTARASEQMAASDPTTLALANLKDRQQKLDAINARLVSESAGLIPPAQMVAVIHDVLSRQQGLVLVSLQNLPVTPLVPPVKPDQKEEGTAASTDLTNASAVASAGSVPASIETGPYLHPVEIVLDGRYLDIVTYLHALEALPYRFYWRVLQLETRTYPLNRVRIELSTVSMEKEWIGV
jgi:MSHA biogenesis protein MshJ